MQIKFEQERETKNTIRFQELAPDVESQKIGTLYVKKSVLKELGYSEDKTLIVELSVQ